MNQFAADRKFILTSNGMSTKGTTPEARQTWRDRADQLKTAMGYAEWGPTGRQADKQPSAQKKASKDAHKSGAAPASNGNGGRKGGKNDNSGKVKLIEVYKGVIGDDNDPALAPHSGLSYVPLGDCLSGVETEAEWNAALKWAAEHLR